METIIGKEVLIRLNEIELLCVLKEVKQGWVLIEESGRLAMINKDIITEIVEAKKDMITNFKKLAKKETPFKSTYHN